MPKEHDKWMPLKKKIDSFKKGSQFNEREIWWCSIGVNVGHEQDGKGVDFCRPVLITKKFSGSVCWVVSLTSSLKEKPYQLHVMFKGRRNQVILSQLKLIDEKRLISKIGNLSKFQFNEIKKMLVVFLFPQAFSMYEVPAASRLDTPSPEGIVTDK
jgi:mRNA-degrading endonuclease toxin of MazEF toxin-antitoxin module